LLERIYDMVSPNGPSRHEQEEIEGKPAAGLGICGADAAVINTNHNTTGARIRDIPATPAIETLDR
jgi:CO/xanthine dehydrogenase Mo-binding subunit